MLPLFPDVPWHVSTLLPQLPHLPLEVIGITELPEGYHFLFVKFEEN